VIYTAKNHMITLLKSTLACIMVTHH